MALTDLYTGAPHRRRLGVKIMARNMSSVASHLSNIVDDSKDFDDRRRLRAPGPVPTDIRGLTGPGT